MSTASSEMSLSQNVFYNDPFEGKTRWRDIDAAGIDHLPTATKCAERAFKIGGVDANGMVGDVIVPESVLQRFISISRELFVPEGALHDQF